LNVGAGQTLFFRAKGRGTVGSYELAVDYLLSTPDEAGSTARTATTITRGQATAASIQAPGDVDYFRVVADRTERLELTALTPDSNLDTIVDVYDRRGNLIAHSNNVPGSTESRISFDVVAGHRYFIRVRGQAGRIGGYELAVDSLLENEL
jgi:hypothetical protein